LRKSRAAPLLGQIYGILFRGWPYGLWRRASVVQAQQQIHRLTSAVNIGEYLAHNNIRPDDEPPLGWRSADLANATKI
jgi:hypothetical protein